MGESGVRVVLEGMVEIWGDRNGCLGGAEVVRRDRAMLSVDGVRPMRWKRWPMITNITDVLQIW